MIESPPLAFFLGFLVMFLIAKLDQWLYGNEIRRLQREAIQAAREWSDAAEAEMDAAKGLYAASKSYHEATQATVDHAQMILAQYRESNDGHPT